MVKMKLYNKLLTNVYDVFSPTVNDTNDASTSDVEEVHPANRMKRLAAVLQHIAKEDDNVPSVTLLTPCRKSKRSNFLP